MRLLTVALIGVWFPLSCVQRRDTEVKAIDTGASAGSLRLVAITDFHGAIEAQTEKFRGQDGQESLFTYGGAAEMATYLNFVRKQSGYPSLVIDAGDLFQGTFVANSAEGEPVIKLYNHLGVAAVAVGNHEFDFGPVGPDSVVRAPGQNPTGALEKAIGQANFPFLAVNIFDKKSGRRPAWVKPSVMVKKDGIQVGIIGAATPSTAFTTNRKNIAHLEFAENITELVIAEAQQLRAQGARLVVLTTHIGGQCYVNLSKYARQIKEVCQGEIFPIAEQLIGHVNAIIAGHTHQNVNKIIARDGKEILIMQAPAKGAGITFADISLEGKIVPYDTVPVCGSKILDKSIVIDGQREIVRGCDKYFLQIDPQQGDEVITIADAMVDGKPATPDPQILEMMKDYVAAANNIKARKSGATVTGEIFRNYTDENPLGNMVADFILSQTGAQVAFTNNGGLRSNLVAGEVTYNDIFEIFPFDDEVYIIELTGVQLKNILRKDVRSRADGGFNWSGIRASADAACQLEKALVIDGAKAQPIVDAQRYRVATIAFMVNKLESLTGIKEDSAKIVDETGIFLRDMIFEAIKGKVLDPNQYFNRQSPRISYNGSCDSGH